MHFIPSARGWRSWYNSSVKKEKTMPTQREPRDENSMRNRRNMEMSLKSLITIAALGIIAIKHIKKAYYRERRRRFMCAIGVAAAVPLIAFLILRMM